MPAAGLFESVRGIIVQQQRREGGSQLAGGEGEPPAERPPPEDAPPSSSKLNLAPPFVSAPPILAPPPPPAPAVSAPHPPLPLDVDHLLPPQRPTRSIPLCQSNMVGPRPTLTQQAKRYADVALEHYNKTKKIKYVLVEAILGNFMQGVDRRGYAHVNFTARRNREGSAEEAFFAELYYCGRRRTKSGFTVIHCSPLGHDFIVGQCGVKRSYDKPLRKDRDFSYCFACSENMKHPRGELFVAGHSAVPCAYAFT